MELDSFSFSEDEIKRFEQSKKKLGNPRGPFEDFQQTSMKGTIITSSIFLVFGLFFLGVSVVRTDVWSCFSFLISIPLLLMGSVLRDEFGNCKRTIVAELECLKNEKKLERFIIYLRVTLFTHHYHAESITNHWVEIFLVFAGGELISLITLKGFHSETSAISIALGLSAILLAVREMYHVFRPNDEIVTMRALKIASKANRKNQNKSSTKESEEPTECPTPA